MRGKTKVGRKNVARYRPAPAKSGAALFLTSFFITLAVIGAAAGLIIADNNSQKLGWGRDVAAFAVSSGNNGVDITVMGGRHEIKALYIRTADDALCKVRIIRSYFIPEPVQLAEIVCARADAYERELLSRYADKYIFTKLWP